MIILEPCVKCKVEYPIELLHELHSSRGNLPNLCGICALAIINEAHGYNRTQFTEGSEAELNRLRALTWRATHATPEAPKETPKS